MKIAIITDTHFGGRRGSKVFHDFFQKFYDNIFFPELGPISVAGLTFGQAKRLISELVSKDILGTSVEISLDDIRSVSVFILGEVFNPGLYTVSSLSTLTNANR